MISTAHIFYIPVLVLVGVFAGYYLGRSAADRERAELQRRAARREKFRRSAQTAEEE